MSNDVAISKEFMRILGQYDPTGSITDIYRKNPLLDAAYKAHQKTAETGNPKYVRKFRKKYTGSKV